MPPGTASGIGPPDRSIPPGMITSVIPGAVQVLIESLFHTFNRLGAVRKFGDSKAETPGIRISRSVFWYHAGAVGRKVGSWEPLADGMA